ncbi:MAG TPA: hypothetical protein VLH79_06450 [Chthonomonadales bacterium]|nr:hypothetical protein [Chthonomonadales bacterium]
MSATGTGAVLALVCLLLSVEVVDAQQNASSSPDAIIIVAPARDSAAIAVTLARARPHADVRSLLGAVAESGGWRLERVEVRDETGTTHPAFGAPRPLGKQTVATATVVGPPLIAGGGLVLQPFLQFLREFGRVDVLFIAPADPGMSPLRTFEGQGVVVRLVRAGGPYHYVLERQEGRGPLPNLPLTQEAAPATDVRAPDQDPSPALARAAVALSWGLAAAALVFWLCRRATRGAHRRRPSRRID